MFSSENQIHFRLRKESWFTKPGHVWRLQLQLIWIPSRCPTNILAQAGDLRKKKRVPTPSVRMSKPPGGSLHGNTGGLVDPVFDVKHRHRCLAQTARFRPLNMNEFSPRSPTPPRPPNPDPLPHLTRLDASPPSVCDGGGF